MDRILTVSDVATILKVQPITVREMFREKRLRAFKVGKAWRTTEKMLEEDIAVIAQGRKPEPLPEPEDNGAGGRLPRIRKVAEPVVAEPMTAEPVVAQAPAFTQNPPPEPAPPAPLKEAIEAPAKPARAARAPKTPVPAAAEIEPEPQQLLF